MTSTLRLSFKICVIVFLLAYPETNLLLAQNKPQKAVNNSESVNLSGGDTIAQIHRVKEYLEIGYGKQQKSEVTNSVVSIGSAEFNKGYMSNPWQLIQGKVPGLAISKPGGDPNGSFYLRLRGLNTIYANTQPLVVIDGVIDASINNIDPNDIESFSILKDASAAAIYGVMGANGVILLTTKKGIKGTTTIDYNVYTTAEMVARNEPVMNAAEWRAISAEVGGGTDYGANTDWLKQIEKTAFSQVHNIAMSGGEGQTTYRASLNYRQGEGVEINTGYTQINGRVNITQKALHDKLTLDLIMGATERRSLFGFNEAFRYASIYNPTAPVKSSDPEFANYDGYFQKGLFDFYNPVSILKLNQNEGKNRLLNLSVKGNYEIIKGLAVNASYSIQNSGNLSGIYYDKNDYWGGYFRNGLASRNAENYSTRLFESMIQYNNDQNAMVNINALGGYSYQDFTDEGFYAQGGDFLTDDFSFNNLSAALDFKNGKGTVTSYKNLNKLIAFFGRVNLNINRTLFFTASARYDGSSRFGANNKWGLFPGIGGGVDLARALNIGFFDYLKFRADFGITGNQPAESYMSLQRLAPQGITYYNGTYSPALSISNNANPNLKWEKNSEFNMGIDFEILKSKLSGSFDLYTRTNSDLLYRFQVPVPPNIYSNAWMNAGKISSRGMEFSIRYNVIEKEGFSYKISLTGSHISKNNLASVSGNYNGSTVSFGSADLGYLGSPGQCCVALVRSEEGKPIGQLIAYVENGVDKNGGLILVDQNNDGQISWYDLTVVGNGLPKSMMGFENEITYNNWDLEIFFRGVFGHDLVNSYLAMYEVPRYVYTYNLPKSAENRRNATNGLLLQNTTGILTDRYVENASFVSLDNLSIGYHFKLQEKSQFNNIRLYFTANNLFYLTGYKGPDPNPRYSDNYFEVSDNQLVPGIDRRDTWPRTRSFTFGANFVF